MNEKQLFEKLTAVHLTQEEKRFMKQNVLLRANRRGILSPLTSFFYFSRSFVRVTALATLLLMCTTLVHASERSIPGDSLYGVKRNVNERVLGVFAVSDTKKAQLETKFVDRRLVEIQKVVDNAQEEVIRATETGRTQAMTSLTSDTQEYIASLTDEVLVHATNAKNLISSVSEKGESENALVLASDLASTIDIHTSTLASSVVITETEESFLETEEIKNPTDTSLNFQRKTESTPSANLSISKPVSTTSDTVAKKDSPSLDSIDLLTNTISSAVSSTLATLSNSSNDVADLGVTIEVAVTKSTSLVDGTKAKQKLDEARKQLTAYKNEMKLTTAKTISVPESTSTESLLSPNVSVSETTVIKPIMSVETEAINKIDTVYPGQVREPVSIAPVDLGNVDTKSVLGQVSSEVSVDIHAVLPIEQAKTPRMTNDTTDIEKVDSSKTAYLLPTLEQIETTIGICESKIEEEKYSDAFISCTKALRYINTLREVSKQRPITIQNPITTSLSVEETNSIVPSQEKGIPEVENVEKVVPQPVPKSDSLTGTVLNAIDSQRTVSSTPIPTKKDL